MKKVSICIPTYNRAKYLKNCIHSIIQNIDFDLQKTEVCISDNNSNDETQEVVEEAQKKIDIKYNRNEINLGIPKNFLKVVSMAEGEFIWLIGDDDLLMPNALKDLNKIMKNHPNVDFIYVNSFHLDSKYVFSKKQPFNKEDLPLKMEKFSKWDKQGELPFFNLIHPKVSFDFLGGMFLSVFRKSKWDESANVLDLEALNDNRTFSHYDNTFPHVKIFSKAFHSSLAYFNKNPLNICLYGAREWEPMYNFIKSVRLVESLDLYKENGLSFWRYVYCKNFALRSFIPNFVYMFLNKETSGYSYINTSQLFLKNCLYPNFYLSFFYFFINRIKRYLLTILRKKII